MAYTHWDDSKWGVNGNENDLGFTFYEADKDLVLKQDGAVSFGLLHFIFDPQDVSVEKKEITVFGAKNIDGDVLRIVALPCPPYYHDEVSFGGKVQPGEPIF